MNTAIDTAYHLYNEAMTLNLRMLELRGDNRDDERIRRICHKAYLRFLRRHQQFMEA